MTVAVQTVSSNAVIDAILNLLNAELATMAGQFTAHSWGDPEDKPPARNYVLVSTYRRFGGSDRLGGLASTSWRVNFRAVGYPRECHALLDRCTRALEEMSIVVGDLTSTGATFETEDPVRQDDDQLGLFTGLRSFIFVL